MTVRSLFRLFAPSLPFVLFLALAGCAAVIPGGPIELYHREMSAEMPAHAIGGEDRRNLTLISSEENTEFCVKYAGSSARVALGKGKILDAAVGNLHGAEIFAKPEGYKEKHMTLAEHPGSAGLRFTFEISDKTGYRPEPWSPPRPTEPALYEPPPSPEASVERPRPAQSAGVLPSDTREEVLGANRWRALLIGVSCYRNPAWRLNTPTKDVQALANLLERDYGFVTTLVCDDKATLVGIREAIDALREQVGQSDNVLVYYAGHGLLRSGGNVGYWLPSDAVSDAGGIPYAEVKELLASLPARRVLLVSDACFSGGFTTRALGVKSKPPATRQESVQVSVDLANNLNASREVITSGNVEEVPDAGTGFLAGHSPFSGTLMTSLEKVPVGAAISTTDLFVDLYANLRSDPSVKQRPQRGMLPGHNGGEFFMVRVAR